MSRSGYVEDWDDQWGLIRYRGAVKSAIRDKRRQAFLREMLYALDARETPEQRFARMRRWAEEELLGATEAPKNVTRNRRKE